jgi:hypothetical protein
MCKCEFMPSHAVPPPPEEREGDVCYLCELVALTMTGRHVLRASAATEVLLEEEVKPSYSLPCDKKEPLRATPPCRM